MSLTLFPSLLLVAQSPDKPLIGQWLTPNDAGPGAQSYGYPVEPGRGRSL